MRPDKPCGSGHDNGSFRHDLRGRYRYRACERAALRGGYFAARYARRRGRRPLDVSPTTRPPALQIVADGGPQTGFGHIGRCLAISEAFGEDAAFSVDDGSAADFIEAHGGRTDAVSAPIVLIDRRAPTDAGEVAALHDAGRRVVLLDDSGSARQVADLVVDPPTAARWTPTRVPRLGGFEHVLLRREVRDAAASRRPGTFAGRVLLALGGSDPTGATPVLADALAAADIDVTAVLGPGYRGSRPSLARVSDRPEVFVNALADTDLFVASYGHSLLEAAHLGVPGIAIALTADQLEDATAFCAHATAELIDMTEGVQAPALVALVAELLASSERRQALADHGRALIDGHGAERVARAIRALAPADQRPHVGRVVGRSGDWNAIDCEICGWVHLDPLPDQAELASMYATTYYSDNPGWLAKERSEQEYWDLEHADKLADWSELLGAETGTLLDVGCASGLLIEFAAARGWQTIGIEPGDEAVAEARAHGLTVHQGLYQDTDIAPGTIDVVHSSSSASISPIRAISCDGRGVSCARAGFSAYTCPTTSTRCSSPPVTSWGKDDWWLAPPFHINYFNFASLEGMLSALGFEPVKRDTTFPVEWFLLMGEDYVGNDTLGADVHRRRMKLETALESLALRRALHEHLATHTLGREAIVHARSPT